MYSTLHTSHPDAKIYGFDCDIVMHELHPQHFHCFCYKLYYLSNFKDFNTIAPACHA